MTDEARQQDEPEAEGEDFQEVPTHPNGDPITPDFPVQDPLHLPPNPPIESEIIPHEDDEPEDEED